MIFFVAIAEKGDYRINHHSSGVNIRKCVGPQQVSWLAERCRVEAIYMVRAIGP